MEISRLKLHSSGIFVALIGLLIAEAFISVSQNYGTNALQSAAGDWLNSNLTLKYHQNGLFSSIGGLSVSPKTTAKPLNLAAEITASASDQLLLAQLSKYSANYQ